MTKGTKTLVILKFSCKFFLTHGSAPSLSSPRTAILKALWITWPKKHHQTHTWRCWALGKQDHLLLAHHTRQSWLTFCSTGLAGSGIWTPRWWDWLRILPTHLENMSLPAPRRMCWCWGISTVPRLPGTCFSWYHRHRKRKAGLPLWAPCVQAFVSFGRIPEMQHLAVTVPRTDQNRCKSGTSRNTCCSQGGAVTRGSLFRSTVWRELNSRDRAPVPL